MQLQTPTNHQADLAALQHQLLRLAEMVDRAVVSAIYAFTRHDRHEAQHIIDNARALNGLRHELEERVLLLLGGQTCLPYEIPAVIAVLFVGAELECIGDYAKAIAMIIVQRAEQLPLEAPASLGQMAHKARDMLQFAMRAMLRGDTEAAARLEQTDDAIEHVYQRVLQEALLPMCEHPEQSQRATYLLWIGYNLKRIADCAVTIADQVVSARVRSGF
jgi:phosphate transport system protein